MKSSSTREEVTERERDEDPRAHQSPTPPETGEWLTLSLAMLFWGGKVKKKTKMFCQSCKAEQHSNVSSHDKHSDMTDEQNRACEIFIIL